VLGGVADGAEQMHRGGVDLHDLAGLVARYGGSLFGEHGGAELEPALKLVTEQHDTILNITPQLDFASFDMDEGFHNELAYFVDLCLGTVDDLATAAQGVEVMRMVEAIYLSAREGREIDLR